MRLPFAYAAQLFLRQEVLCTLRLSKVSEAMWLQALARHLICIIGLSNAPTTSV